MINHDPCVSNAEIQQRLFEDKSAIQALIADGYHVLTMIAYHSEQTLETHTLPVFEEDSIDDLANRYFDFFPMECKQTLQAIEEDNKLLYSSNGVSDGGLMGRHCTIPQLLWVLLKARFPDEAVDPQGFRRLTKEILRVLPKLKGSNPYGAKPVTV